MTKKSKASGTMIVGWGIWASLLTPGVQQLFYAQGARWVFIALFSFLLSLLLTPIVRHLASTFSVLDQPASRKMHKKATPLLGGIAVYLGFTVALLVNNILDWSLCAILIAGTIIMLVSVIDDIKILSAQLKLVFQVAAAGLVYFSGVQITIFPTHGVSETIFYVSQGGNFIVSFLWIIGITNAMNFLDGTDGLAAGLGVVISVFLGVVAFQTNQAYLGWCAIAMAGSCLGFLPYNFRPSGPATIFLGDAGSTYIGFILACLAITGDWAAHNPLMSICTPIMIFAVLIYDMVHTTIARIASGKVRSFHEWVSYVGKDHIHHRMFRLFQGNKRTVSLILTISTCFGLSAVILRLSDDTFHSLLIVSQGVIACIMFSSISFYQERALVRAEMNKRPYRVQKTMPVRVRLEGDKQDLKGLLMDTSEQGARLLFRTSGNIFADKRVTIALQTNDSKDTVISWPRGKVVRTRTVMFSEDDNVEEYTECGIKFPNGNQYDILQLIKALEVNQFTTSNHDKSENIASHKNDPLGAYELPQMAV